MRARKRSGQFPVELGMTDHTMSRVEVEEFLRTNHRADEYGQRNAVPDELLVRVQPETIVAAKNIAA